MKTAILLLLMVGCTTHAERWPDATAFAAAADYEMMYRRVERCSRLTGSFESVVFHVAPDGTLGPQVMGRWEPPHLIYLTDFVVSRNVTDTIEHEMLHDILQNGDSTHQDPAWVACQLLP